MKMNLPNPPSFEEIKKVAFDLGWDDVAVTDAMIPEEDQQSYREWISKNFQGKLSYMENAIRCSPSQLLPGAKSAILFISYYKQEKKFFQPHKGLIASYARGRDYHAIHRKRLKKFIRWFEESTGQTGSAKGFSDSTPILEKSLAIKAGLGWFGKNTLMIHRKFGTFFLISGILTTVELTPSSPLPNATRFPRCGTCTRCLDACPTQAIVSPYHLDASLCLSYHLIESKEDVNLDIQAKNPGYAFGCDICQDVCPHNQRTPLSSHPEFAETAEIGSYLTLENMQKIEQFPEMLFGTPLQRRGAKGLRFSLNALMKNSN